MGYKGCVLTLLLQCVRGENDQPQCYYAKAPAAEEASGMDMVDPECGGGGGGGTNGGLVVNK